MRVLANETIPAAVINALVSRGHDVKWIRTTAPGASDKTVLEIAQREGRLIVTFDKDFGELAFRAGLPSTCGIVTVQQDAGAAGRSGFPSKTEAIAWMTFVPRLRMVEM
jgi:predicted nuclease of predicted toxin-antitoxin system